MRHHRQHFIHSIESYLMRFVLLITAPISHHNAWHGYYFAQAALEQGHCVQVFFYGDGVQVANRLLCPAQDALNLSQLWQHLAQKYHIELAVCVAAALKRGISDADNAKRHHLQGHNLAQGFTLTGLGTLTEWLLSADRHLSFVGA
jgi:tRNA 2-thiouridine synthesizing protein D